MAIIVEDGSGVVGANSYVSVEELKSYAANRGITLPLEEKLPILLINAMDYIESKRSEFQGTRVFSNGLQWPRSNVVVDGVAVPMTAIPSELKLAQCQLAIDNIDYDLMPVDTGYAVASEKIDVIEVEYATGGRLSGSARSAAPAFSKAEALLSVLYGRTGMKLSVIRK